MSQQVNLFNPALLPRRELFSARNVAIGGGLALAVVVVGAVGAMLLARAQAGALSASKTQLAAAQELLNATTQAAAAAKPGAAVQLELDRANALLATQKTVLTLVAPAGDKTAAGFGQYLRGLSRQSMSGLWLDYIVIGNHPGDMRIAGKTLDGALVADYVGRLNREAAFAGQGFTSLEMARGSEKPEAASGTAAAEPKPATWVEFELSAAPGDNRAGEQADGGTKKAEGKS